MEIVKLTIGRREHIDFPELGLCGITAKIDTGAYTTALHCHDIREENGVLYFKLLDPSHPDYTEKEQKFTTYSQKEIKNSFGESEKRYIIKTIIRIGKKRIVPLSVNEITDLIRFVPIRIRVFIMYRFSDSPNEFFISF